MTADEVIRQLRAPDQSAIDRVAPSASGAANIDKLAALDAEAQTIRVWDPMVIPGNLQTPAYSEAVIKAAQPKLPHYDVRRRVLLKDQRAKAFLGHTSGERLQTAWFAIGERVITRCIDLVDEGTMHDDQLRHLLALADHPKIVVQVLPDMTITPNLAQSFALYGLDDNHRVGYVETFVGSWYSTRLDALARMHSTFSDITREAMSPQSTRQFIEEVLGSWRSPKNTSPEPTMEPRSSSLPTARAEATASASRERARGWRTGP